MIKEGCENKCALLILLIFFLNHKNLSFHWGIRIEKGEEILWNKFIYFLKYMLDTIIGTHKKSYE